jgi:peptidoglycan L-alanyl-D-glutamate endopeptidase CwlK
MPEILHPERLDGVEPRLAAVVHAAAEHVAILVVEGVRSDEQAYINYGKGRTAAQLRPKGIAAKYADPSAAKVTWLSDPLATKHRKQGDGFGHAVDIMPASGDWNDRAGFDAIAKAMFAAAETQGTAIRWGADWDADGNPRERGETDSPHFELGGAAPAARPAANSRPTLHRGMMGAHVRDLQRLLGVKQDGDFGGITDAAVRAAQAKHSLAVDGVVGSATWAVLEA